MTSFKLIDFHNKVPGVLDHLCRASCVIKHCTYKAQERLTRISFGTCKVCEAKGRWVDIPTSTEKSEYGICPWMLARDADLACGSLYIGCKLGMGIFRFQNRLFEKSKGCMGSSLGL